MRVRVSKLRGLIVSLVGDESMSMEEVDEFMAHLKPRQAKVILGVHVDDAMGGMGAMMLMPRRTESAPTSVKPEPLKISMPTTPRNQPAHSRFPATTTSTCTDIQGAL